MTSSQRSFRAARPGDAAEIAALVHSAYRGDTSRQGWTTEADLLDGARISVEQVTDVIGDPHSIVLVLFDAGGLLACCHVEDRGDGLAYFGMFAVRPGSQGGGVGSRTVAQAQLLARESFGAQRMELTVIGRRRELIAWYERLGFSPTGETRPFPYGDERFGVPRVDDLHFVVLSKNLNC